MSNRTPQYRRYRGKYARVKIDGKLIHLGRYDSPESRAKYKRLITHWASHQPIDEVREGKPVAAVPESVVEMTLKHLTPVVSDMARLQLASGARPGEICSLTPSQIDRSGDVWHYRPAQHKTLWKGRERVVCFGPQAQEILRRYLLRPADSPCFSPREALAQQLFRAGFPVSANHPDIEFDYETAFSYPCTHDTRIDYRDWH